MVSVVIKLVAASLLMVAAGVPVLETSKALLLAASLLALAFGKCRCEWRRIGVATMVVIGVTGVRAVLPRADIPEAHNAFMVLNTGEALQRGLPAEVFASWKARFDALYPPDDEPYQPRSEWRKYERPKSLFTSSADAIWRKAKYTRQVDRIDFRSLGEFRGGFANELQYPWWVGELRRESMPFYVMYELTQASVGSTLAWKGQVFWERADGRFDEIVHEQTAIREITPEDAGKRVYAAFFPTPGMVLSREGDLDFSMEPSLKLRLSDWVDILLIVIAAVSILMCTVSVPWRGYIRALSIFAAGYSMMAVFVWLSFGKYLGKAYPPHGGGDDGLVHDGWGRVMAMLAGSGHVMEALKGNEAVYWFTPGMRYVRMIEKLVFGDTNHLYALLLACVPIVIFYLARHFIGTWWAWAMTAAFLVLPVGNLSFLQYVANGKLGYGEAVAGGLFLLGLVLMLRTQPAWGGTDRDLPVVWGAGAALAMSMFIRPNFAFAVAWLGAAYAWASLRRKDAWPVVVLGLGLGLALWMPFHNWFYGGEFHLISKSGDTISVPIGVGDYFSALRDVLHGRFDTHATKLTSGQLTGWLWAPGLILSGRLVQAAWVALGVKLLALFVTCWIALRWIAGGCKKGTDLAVVAVASICAHIPMLFIFSTHYRFAMLGWDLSLVVLIVWLVRLREGAPSATAVVYRI